MNNFVSYLYVLLTVLFTVYSQVMLKTRIMYMGAMPAAWAEKLSFIAGLFLDPWILSCFAAGFIASLFWMLAISRLPLSQAYPFTSLTFALILICSAILFHEPVTFKKACGLVCIICGIIISNLG